MTQGYQKKIWQIQKPNIKSSAKIAAKLDVSSLISQLLTIRGIEDEREAEKFLYPNLDMMYSPFLMRDMERAVERIKKAIENGERIWIYGDYDVDGTTATALLLGVFKYLGVDVNYYIPNRFDEGYGLNIDAITKLSEQGCNLIISVDCGINSVAEIEHANELGIDAIITDHHEPKYENIPAAYAVLNPKIPPTPLLKGGEKYPFDGLAGVGVAFKLAHALLESEGEGLSPFLKTQLDLVSLGTVVDVASLIDENRILAKFGLEELNKRERVGIRALCDVAGHESGKEITSYTLGFLLGPRLNAAGRLDTAHKVVELLTTESYEDALNIARELDSENQQRQEIERKILEHAKDKIKTYVDLDKEKALVLADEEWHRGVIGIVASRLVDAYYRPTLLIALEGSEGHGSGRSIPEFNLFEGLNKCKELMLGFGGHKAAAGLSIEKGKISKLRSKFSQVVSSQLSEDDLTPKVKIDLEVSASQLTMQAIEELRLLEPCGCGNPRPVMAISEASIYGAPYLMGRNNEHLKFMISDGRQNLETIGWRMAPLLIALKNKNITVDLAFHPGINEWKNTRRIQLTLDDIHINSPRSKAQDIYPPLNVPSPVKIFDRRNRDKAEYLRKLLARKERTFLYVRNDAALQQLAKIDDQIPLGLCSAELSHDQRQELLQQFECGQLPTIASSVIFEHLPYVKHFVFCHPVPAWNIFFDCCKSAFETEETTYIHLIFGAKDTEVMRDMLEWEYPGRETLGKLYKLIENIAQKNGTLVEWDELIKQADHLSLKEQTVRSAITIFEELQLVERPNALDFATIHFLSKPQQKRSLNESELFLRGEQLKQTALSFSDFLLKKTPEELFKELKHGVA
ncbi:MAG: single-stranded-DNA-specific exonuclease RecJ [Candidatus Poribacteria bacterium]